MASSEPGRTSTIKPQPDRVQFQELAEFEVEAAKFLDQLSTEKQYTYQPQRKKVKPAMDVEALVAERKAVQELGDTNWIGKLLGMLLINSTIIYTNFLVQNTVLLTLSLKDRTSSNRLWEVVRSLDSHVKP